MKQDNAPPLMRALPTFASVGIKRTQAYKLINAGVVTVVKVGRSTYIRRTDWDAFLANLPAIPAVKPAVAA